MKGCIVTRLAESTTPNVTLKIQRSSNETLKSVLAVTSPGLTLRLLISYIYIYIYIYIYMTLVT